MPKPPPMFAKTDALCTLVVKGLHQSEVAVLDAIVHRRRGELLTSGGRTSRNAMIVAILRNAITNERARLSRMSG